MSAAGVSFPMRLVRAVRRRYAAWTRARLGVQARAASSARAQGRCLLLDMDWYGYANLKLGPSIAACPAFHERVTVLPVPRETVFDIRRTGEPPRRFEAAPDGCVIRHRDYALWAICRTSVVKELGFCPSASPDAETIRLIDRYYDWAIRCIDGVERVLDRLRPDAVAVFQGGLFDSRCVAACAQRRGIRVIAVETSLIGDRALVDGWSGAIVNRHALAALGSTLYEVEQPGDALDPVAFWKASLARKGEHHRTGGVPVESLSLPDGKTLVLVLGQVAGDASLTMDSPLYEHSAELIADVLAVAGRHPAWHVVARLHPKEAWNKDTRGDPDGPGEYLANLTRRALERMGLANHPQLTVVEGPGVDTYALMERASVGVTINSQSGLEMILMGKPVVTAGRCLYAGNGFTWDVGRRALLASAIEGALAQGLTPEETARARAFARYLFGHYLMPIDPVAAGLRARRWSEILGLPLEA